MTGIIIQARMGSSRLPGKVLMQIGDRKLLEHILERLKYLKIPDCKVVIATSVEKQDDAIEVFCEERSVACFRGSEENVLQRYYECAKLYGFQNIVRLTADNPFIDIEELERLIKLHQSGQNDYSYSYEELPIGVGAEIFSMNALEKVMKLAYKENHFEHVDDYIVENMEQFVCKRLAINGAKRYPEVRLTVDTIEDYKKVCFIAEYFEDENASTEELLRCERMYWEKREMR